MQILHLVMFNCILESNFMPTSLSVLMDMIVFYSPSSLNSTTSKTRTCISSWLSLFLLIYSEPRMANGTIAYAWFKIYSIIFFYQTLTPSTVLKWPKVKAAQNISKQCMTFHPCCWIDKGQRSSMAWMCRKFCFLKEWLTFWLNQSMLLHWTFICCLVLSLAGCLIWKVAMYCKIKVQVAGSSWYPLAQRTNKFLFPDSPLNIQL